MAFSQDKVCFTREYESRKINTVKEILEVSEQLQTLNMDIWERLKIQERQQDSIVFKNDSLWFMYQYQREKIRQQELLINTQKERIKKDRWLKLGIFTSGILNVFLVAQVLRK